MIVHYLRYLKVYQRICTVDYPLNNKCQILLVNERVSSLTKDENRGTVTVDIIHLTAKMYAVSLFTDILYINILIKCEEGIPSKNKLQ